MAIKLTNKQIVAKLDDAQLIALAEKFSMGLNDKLPRAECNDFVVAFCKDNSIDLSAYISEKAKKEIEEAAKKADEKEQKNANVEAADGELFVYLKNSIKFRGERHEKGEKIAVTPQEKAYLKRIGVIDFPPRTEDEL